jgi:hypothetical protein
MTSGNEKFIFFQILEDSDAYLLKNRTVSFQIKMKCNVTKNIRMGILYYTGTANALPVSIVSNFNSNGVDPIFAENITIANAKTKIVNSLWTIFSVNATLPNTLNNVIVACWVNENWEQNVILDVAEAGLYLGTNLMNWNYNVHEDLLRCMRYYEKSYDLDVSPGTNTIAGSWMSYVPVAGKISVMPIVPVIQKLKFPTVTCYTLEGSQNSIGEYNANGTLIASHSPVINVSSRNFYFSTALNCSAGNFMRFHWVAECEL